MLWWDSSAYSVVYDEDLCPILAVIGKIKKGVGTSSCVLISGDMFEHLC